MKLSCIGTGFALALLGTLASRADEPTAAVAKEAKPKLLADAELLKNLQAAVGAVEKLERELRLFNRERKEAAPKNQAPLVEAAPLPTRPEAKLGKPPDQRDTERELDKLVAAMKAEKFSSDPTDYRNPVRDFKERVALEEAEICCVRAWQSLGTAQARLGDMTAAHRSWIQALDRASRCSNVDEMRLALIDLAIDQETAGDHDAALATLSKAEELVLRSRSSRTSLQFSLMDAETTYPGVGDCLVLARARERVKDRSSEMSFAMAIRVAEADEDPIGKASALIAIAKAQRPDDARVTRNRATTFALSLEDDLEKNAVLEATLRACLQAGDEKLTLETIGEPLKPHVKAYLIWVVADELATGDRMPTPDIVARVLGLAEKAQFDRPSIKERVFAKLAIAQARLGNDGAYRTLEAHQAVDKVFLVADDIRKLNVMCALARAYLEQGKRDNAKETVQVAIEIAGEGLSEWRRLFPMPELVRLQAQTGDIAGALETAQALEHIPSRIAALTAVAVAKAKGGELSAARKILAKALTAVAGITSEDLWLYTDVTRTEKFIEFGSRPERNSAPDPAIQLARGQQMKAKALRAIATAQLTMGDVDGALATAGEIKTCGKLGVREMAAVCTEITTARLAARDYKAIQQAIDLIEYNDRPALQYIDRPTAHALQRIYFRERVSDDLRQGKASGLLAVCLEIENTASIASVKLQGFVGFAEGVVAFKNAPATAGPKAPDPKPATR